MKYCPVCGNASEDNEMFCNSCGTKLPAVQNQTGTQAAPAAPVQEAPVKKKSKKKIIIPIVIVLVLLLLGGIVLTVGGVILAIGLGNDNEPSGDNVIAYDETTKATEDTYDDETAAAEETTEAEAEETGITRGTVEGNVYKNDSVGLTFTPGSSWIYYTDEQIAETLQVGLDVMDVDNFSAALVEQLSMMDMLAQDTATGTSVNVTFENLVLTGSKGISDERYYDAVVAQFEAVSGMEISDVKEMTYTTIGDYEYASFDYTVTTNEVEMQIRTLFRKADTHMVIIAISTVYGSLDEVEAMLS